VWLDSSLAQGKVRDLSHWFHQCKRQAVKSLLFLFKQALERVHKLCFFKCAVWEFLHTLGVYFVEQIL